MRGLRNPMLPADEAFLAVWNAAPSLGQAAARLNITPRQATMRAAALRKRHAGVKYFSSAQGRGGRAWAHGPKAKICPGCGKSFSCRSAYDIARKVYCSPACYLAAAKSRAQLKREEMSVTAFCRECGAAMRLSISSFRRYCSRSCARSSGARAAAEARA